MSPFPASPRGLFSAFPTPYFIPASQTQEGQERLREYYEALGRFVDMFARAETAVTLTLWHYAKTSPEMAKIVFAGVRIELGSTYIRQLAAITRAPRELRDDLEDVLQQLGIINGVRNAILHYGTETESVAKGNAIVSDALKAKGEPSSFPISPTILTQMRFDLYKIIGHLNVRHLGKTPGYTILGDPTLRSWQYKRPSPRKGRSKKREDRRRKARDPRPPRPPES
jgi:hypothetical protein